MPVDSPHPEYVASIGRWTRCLDCFAGSDVVKSKGTDYLPKLSGQTLTEYDAFVKRTLFYPVLDRTVMGLTGTITRKPPAIVAPEPVMEQLEDVTLTGETLQEFTQSMLDQLLVTGRVGIQIDYPVEQQADKDPPRPYWILWRADQILNWRISKQYDGELALSLVVCREDRSEILPSDPFVRVTSPQYRVFSLQNGIVVITVWHRAGDKWVSETPIIPMRRGEPLDEIPFIICGPRGVSATVDKPPLLDLVDVNLSHYVNSADLEHGRHFTGLPTPYITGYVQPPDASAALMRIGSSEAWTMPNADAKVGFLEFTGQGLGELRLALEHKEKLMAILGSRMLEGQPARSETAEAVRLRQSGEHASLATIAMSASHALTEVLKCHAWWAGFEDDVAKTCSITLNSDFFETQLTAQEAQALMALWQSGGISYETFYWNLQRGEWARPGVDVEQEEADISAGQTETATGIEEPSEAPEPPEAEDTPSSEDTTGSGEQD